MKGTRLSVVSPLLGSYNDLNICLCLAAVQALAPQVLQFMPAAVAEIEQVPHRLETEGQRQRSADARRRL